VRSQRYSRLTVALVLASGGWLSSCGGTAVDSLGLDPATENAGVVASSKSSAADRADRRAFDGAPPVRPHESFGMACVQCHNREGREVEGVGFAPPSPHESTAGLSALSNCAQCHVARATDTTWRDNEFVGVPQDLRSGRRATRGAPPVMPHRVFMRENCQACHTGEAAREEIRTSHPERGRCVQCHVEQNTNEVFSGEGSWSENAS